MTATLNERQIALLKKLRGGKASASPLDSGLERRRGPHRLSPAQFRILFEEKLHPGNAFNGSLAIEYRGELSIVALESALNEIVLRHEVLRANVDLDLDEPLLHIRPPSEMRVALVDLTSLSPTDQYERATAEASAHVRRPINIETAPCLITAMAFKLAEDHYAVVFAMHMLAFDAPSGVIFFDELVRGYQAALAGSPLQLPPLLYQYPDVVRWRRERQTSRAQDIAYWTQRLSKLGAEQQLPTDHGRPAEVAFDALRAPFQLRNTLAAQLKATARANRVSFYMVLLTALKVTLFRHAACDLPIGAWTTQRSAVNAGLIGPFVNTIVYCTDISEDDSLATCLAKVRAAAIEASAHAGTPFEEIAAAVSPLRSSRFNPFFQTHFILQEIGNEQDVCGFSLSPLDARITASGGYDIELVMRDMTRGVEGHFELNAQLFDQVAAERLTDRFLRVLEALTTDLDQKVGEVPLGDGPPALRTAGPQALAPLIDRLFIHSSDRVAMIDALGRETSFGDLLAQSAAFEIGMGTDDGGNAPVMIITGAGLDFVAPMLAALRTGRPFLMLGRDAPEPLLRESITQTGVRWVWTEAPEILPRLGVPLLCPGVCNQATGVAEPARHISGNRTAYFQWTSGTRGRPHITAISRDSLAGYLAAIGTAFEFDQRVRILKLADPGFDVGIEETLPVLLAGGSVVAPGERCSDPEILDNELRRSQANTLNIAASLWRAWAAWLFETGAEPPEQLARIIIGSDEPDLKMVRNWQARYGHQTRLFNAYGTAQTAITNLVYPVPGADALKHMARLPIGMPIRGQGAQIVDRAGRPVPVGVVGEIVLSGPGRDGFATGDLGRQRTDGQFEFIGRRDGRTKRIGQWTDANIVASALRADPGVANVAYRFEDGKSVLRVWLTKSAATSVQHLRSRLEASLPRWAIPDLIEVAGEETVDHLGRIQATTEAEATVQDLWCAVVGRRLPCDKDVFRLGVTSFDCLRFLAAAARAGLKLELAFVYDHPTIADQAAKLAEFD